MSKRQRHTPAAKPGQRLSRLLYVGAMAMAMLLTPAPSPAQEQSEPPPVHSFDLDQQDSQIETDEAVLMDFFYGMTNYPDTVSAPLSPDPDTASGLNKDDFLDNPGALNPPPDGAPQTTGTHSGSLNQPVPTDAAVFSGAPLPPSAMGQPPTTPSLPPPPGATATESGSTGQSLPKPLWDNVPSAAQKNTHNTYLSDAPAPQYDASQGQWIQLEVGQADSGGIPAAAPPSSRSGSVSTLPTVTGKIEPDKEGVAPAASTTAPKTGAAVSPPEMDANTRPVPSTATDRLQLRELFADMLPAEGQGARIPAGSNVDTAPGATAASGSQPGGSAAASPAIGPDSAILNAGGLLTTESYFGSAAILPPLTDKPAVTSAKPAAGAVATKPPETEAPAPGKTNLSAPPLPPGTPAKTKSAAKKIGKKTPSAGQAKSSAQPAPAAGRVSLILINETGNERIGEVYRSVLSKMGYNIISVGNKPSGGTSSGRTVINYNSNAKAKAQAVARHLPGQKSLVEAKKGEVLAADVMVFLK